MIELAIVSALILCIEAKDCYLSCDQVQITYDKQLCYQNCDEKIIAGATVGGFLGLCFLLCFACYCKHRNHVSMYFLTRDLKKKMNRVNPQDYTRQTFERDKNQFISAINKSDIFNNFFFEVKKKKCGMGVYSDSFESFQQGDFLTRIMFKGKDSYSTYFAQGYFLCKNGKPFVWFTKRYEPHELAIQYGLAEVILFESQRSNRQAWVGTWSAIQQQDNKDVGGKWSLIMRVTGITNHLQQIGSQFNLG